MVTSPRSNRIRGMVLASSIALAAGLFALRPWSAQAAPTETLKGSLEGRAATNYRVFLHQNDVVTVRGGADGDLDAYLTAPGDTPRVVAKDDGKQFTVNIRVRIRETGYYGLRLENGDNYALDYTVFVEREQE